jgi:cytochrome b
MPQSTSPGAVHVWDLFIRIFHWTVVAGFAIAYLTEGEPLWLHLTAGFAVAGFVAARIVWGFVGPEHARFSDFVYRPSAVIGDLRDLATGSSRRYLGHSPAGGAMVIALLVSLAATTGTGTIMYFTGKPDEPRAAETLQAAPAGTAEDNEAVGDERGGDEREESPLKEVHEFLANFTIFLVILHIGGVALSSFAHRENLPRSLLTGEKRI